MENVMMKVDGGGGEGNRFMQIMFTHTQSTRILSVKCPKINFPCVGPMVCK